MNKFESWMIGYRKIPNLSYTKGERICAWFMAGTYILALIALLGSGIIAILMGSSVLEENGKAIIAVALTCGFISIIAMMGWLKIVLEATVRQCKDVL